ncbi:hypothetical protein AALP_AA7G013600 [Arabis alpina]|uniref:TFIIS N-terminal domain-containing protein n=1 Tax=Arabis alpina TaxID=50452 RepID=A0A087GFB9_ARAAL|nr:hypothetical protein AALP_AA7G013600 [Arabis alpina]
MVKEKRPKKDEEMENLFRSMRKKSKVEKTVQEIAMQVEEVMASLEIAVGDDVELNKQGKPAISKLIKLPLLSDSLSKKQLQAIFLDHGVLSLLKNWLEPLPDGSLPNINVRAAVLKILNDLPVDLDQECIREQMEKSSLGKVLMFLSKSDEETTPNRRLATELVNKWSRIIYNKSTRYDQMYSQEEIEENQQIILKRQNKKAPKVSERKATDFDVEVDFESKKLIKIPEEQKYHEQCRRTLPSVLQRNFVTENSKLLSSFKWTIITSMII